MNLSYWEYKEWLSNIDFTIIGSGIVGLNCAIKLKTDFPKSKVLIIEKGLLPQGASTKNAGFACFGSLSEIISDLRTHTEHEVVQLIQNRINGLRLLRDIVGDKAMDYQQLGSYELFLDDSDTLYESSIQHLESVNQMLYPIFESKVFTFKPNTFGFKGIKQHYCFNPFEGQLDTGKLMSSLLRKAQTLGVIVLNNCEVTHISETNTEVKIKTDNVEFKTAKVCIATNGFASQFMNESVKPARAQVLITKPIQNLHIKGTFHFDEGFYYFRNINDRILFGGGRNLDFKGEETTEFGETHLIQDKLEQLLRTTILPNTPFQIERRWSGIMGVGPQKKPVIKQLSNHVFCGVRLGGMGVAIGSLVGNDLANLLNQS